MAMKELTELRLTYKKLEDENTNFNLKLQGKIKLHKFRVHDMVIETTLIEKEKRVDNPKALEKICKLAEWGDDAGSKITISIGIIEGPYITIDLSETPEIIKYIYYGIIIINDDDMDKFIETYEK